MLQVYLARGHPLDQLVSTDPKNLTALSDPTDRLSPRRAPLAGFAAASAGRQATDLAPAPHLAPGPGPGSAPDLGPDPDPDPAVVHLKLFFPTGVPKSRPDYPPGPGVGFRQCKKPKKSNPRAQNSNKHPLKISKKNIFSERKTLTKRDPQSGALTLKC